MLWHSAPVDLIPAETCVDLWRVGLQAQPPSRMQRFFAGLCHAERARAQRFRLRAKYNEFVVTRGLLRHLLGRFLQIPPAELRFRFGAHGKPLLCDEQADFSFNVSHSHGLGLIAITRKHAIGVDVELSRPNNNYERLCWRFFSPAESRALLGLPPEQRQDAFFACWTRKEAFVKALGTGISLGLDQFDVSLRPAEPVAVLRTHYDPADAARWSLVDLDVGTPYRAALAVEGHAFTVRCWDDQEDI